VNFIARSLASPCNSSSHPIAFAFAYSFLFL
jgi:hypothetical protein